MTSTLELADAAWLTVSYHEAGHAAAAIYYQIPLEYMRIQTTGSLLGDPDSNGEVVRSISPDWDDDESIAQSIVVSLAGSEAEAWACQYLEGRSHRWASRRVRRGAEIDMANVQNCIEQMADPSRRVLRAIERETESVVAEMWDPIARIAEAVRECGGYLTGDQIYRAA